MSLIRQGAGRFSVQTTRFSGNKIDRDDREIPTQVGEEFAERHNMYFLETSAKESDNVERLFMQIAEDLMKVSGPGRVCSKQAPNRNNSARLGQTRLGVSNTLKSVSLLTPALEGSIEEGLLQQARMTNVPRYDPNSYNVDPANQDSGCCSRLN